MALTDEEKKRIEEEEQFRATARAKAEADAKKAEADKKSKNSAIGCLGCLGVLFVLWLIGTFTGSQKGDSSGSAGSSAKTAVSDAECRQQLSCWGEKHLIAASVRCDDAVERLAKYSAQWTDGMLEPKFSRYRWKDQPKGIVTYIGDKVRFQNGFGAYQNMIYECDYDPTIERPIDARAEAGKLP
jgi:hypothetical protein